LGARGVGGDTCRANVAPRANRERVRELDEDDKKVVKLRKARGLLKKCLQNIFDPFRGS